MQKHPSPGFGWVTRVSSQFPLCQPLPPPMSLWRSQGCCAGGHLPCHLSLSAGVHVMSQKGQLPLLRQPRRWHHDAFYCCGGVNPTIPHYFCLNGHLPLKKIQITRNHPLCLRGNCHSGREGCCRGACGPLVRVAPFPPAAFRYSLCARF